MLGGRIEGKRREEVRGRGKKEKEGRQKGEEMKGGGESSDNPEDETSDSWGRTFTYLT